MDDDEFPLPVAILTIAIAAIVLIWQRSRDWLSAATPPDQGLPAAAFLAAAAPMASASTSSCP
ncbi:MAG: hypothetical protein KDB72_11505 [Mycobacterium sp.]|nr:hypothetical protein [Mycobacterium sp.]